MIEQAAHAGLDFIEIPMLHPETFDARRHRRHLEAVGLACVTSLGLPKHAHMPRQPQKAVSFLTGVLDPIEELSARDLTGCTGYAIGALTEQGPTPQDQGRMVDGLSQVAEDARSRGIGLGLETINCYEKSVRSAQTPHATKRPQGR